MSMFVKQILEKSISARRHAFIPPSVDCPLQFDDTNINFQTQILEKSGFSEETCLHPSLCRLPRTRSLSLSIEEAATVMFSMVAAAWVAGKACLRDAINIRTAKDKRLLSELTRN
ncbi:hypothetical protein RJ640_014740 [Escallonia rubra]|uniref:FAE domain-containing protein n=1 Tax=Escallonia rubra TaxID=112253 RepID=A0AA88RIG9_9ASTE|nr:hypothetical protein RJ640_014740 [Escallonia rubra]